MVGAPARPRLSLVQRALIAALGVLIITVQVMLVFAYRNLGKTTVTYGTATDVVTGLARVQRETLELAIELERLRLPRRARRARRASWPVGPADRGHTRLRAARRVEQEGLERARRRLKSFDAELARRGRTDSRAAGPLAPVLEGQSTPSRSPS
jgi:hypothetical protein